MHSFSKNSAYKYYTQKDVLNIGGFSDTIFEVISNFVENGNEKDIWIQTIESIEL